MSISIKINPKITADELYQFYVENDICEKGLGIETATLPLEQNSLTVAAFDGDKLVGIADAMFNGVAAVLMEFCVANYLQGEGNELENGSMMEKDETGIGKMMERYWWKNFTEWEHISFQLQFVRSLKKASMKA